MNPVRFRTRSCGRGLSVGNPLSGYDSTNGCEKFVSDPLISGTYPRRSVTGESLVSMIQTVRPRPRTAAG